MRIEVTQEDIDAGTPTDGTSCPIALAITRQTGEVWTVSNYFAIPIETHNAYPIPESAQLFVRRFDAKKEVQPFDFNLNIPAPAFPTKENPDV